jgi:hypothetical protein
MNGSVENGKNRLARRSRPVQVAVLAALFLLLVTSSACNLMWRRVSERERLYAVESARHEIESGHCVGGLESLDRAEAKLDIGLFAREAVESRSRCYEKLGMQELATAHRRLLSDFYTTEPMALPDADGSSVFRVSNSSVSKYELPPGWLKMESPRYSEYARRAKIVGRVIVAFNLAKDGKPRRIRVLEMPHPLLASWAIEAIARSEPKEKRKPVILPGVRYFASFNFEWRWAKSKAKPGR